jgi:hypothetical protein
MWKLIIIITRQTLAYASFVAIVDVDHLEVINWVSFEIMACVAHIILKQVFGYFGVSFRDGLLEAYTWKFFILEKYK